MSSLSKQGVLSTSGDINPNLMVNSYNMLLDGSSAALGSWRRAGTSYMNQSRVLIQNGMYGFQNSGIQTGNDGSCYGIDNFPTDASTNYIISMWARIVEGTEAYAGYNVYAATDVGGSYTKIDKNYRVTPLTKEWTRCWYEFKTNTSTKRNIYIGITTGETSVTTQMCLVKLEKGSVLTPWCPKEGDTIYTSSEVGFNEFINYPIGSIADNYVVGNHFYEL